MSYKKINEKGPYRKWAGEMRKVMPADISKEYFKVKEEKGQEEADKIVEHYRKQSKTFEPQEKQM